MTSPDTLPAGPEMDRLVAEKVMGWSVEEIGGSLLGLSGGRLISKVCEHRENGRVISFHPSRDIGNAWEVVERLTESTYSVRVIASKDQALVRMVERGIHAYANTAPLAICRAALKAVGG